MKQTNPSCLRGCLIALTLATILAQGSLANTQTHLSPKPFDISDQLLATALNEFARQSDRQILFSTAVVHAKRTEGLKGEWEPEAALRQLLKGTGLTYRLTADNTILIESPRAKETATVPGPETLMRLAQVNQAAPSPTENAQNPENQTSGQDPPLQEDLEEIVVIGTHIRGIENTTAPLIVIDREAIDRSGYATTQDLFRALPQNFAGGQSGATEDGVYGNGRDRATNFTAATGINLRGLGTSATLVLVNGNRLAPSAFGSVTDVSLIPLAAIERVEILPDGSSALYGSDAVGGVVNIVLKQNYQGADTSARYGVVTDGDRSDANVSQSIGKKWASGSIAATLQYQQQDALNAGDRSFSRSLTEPNDLFPEAEGFGSAVHATQDLSEQVEGHISALFSRRDISRSTSDGSLGGQLSNSSASSRAASIVTGVEYELGSDWSIGFDGHYSALDGDLLTNRISGLFGSEITTNNTEALEKSVEMILSGPLLRKSSDSLKGAFGISYRDNEFRQHTVLYRGGVLDRRTDRYVKSAFAEIFLPIVREADRALLTRTFDISAAVRYDDYSDFGSTTNPRLGIRWAPLKNLSLRAAYSRSFRAPNAFESLNSAISVLLTDSFANPEGPGTVPVFVQAGSQELGPERARTIDFGVEYSPGWCQGLSLGFNYYDVDFEDRIIAPPFNANALLQPTVFGDLISTIESDAEAQSFLDTALANGFEYADLVGTGAAGVRYVVDFRQQNAAIVRQGGMDFIAEYIKNVKDGVLGARLNLGLITKIDTAFSEGAMLTDVVDTFGNPVRWRLRYDVNWAGRFWLVNIAVNYVGNYADTSQLGSPRVSSWTTLDLTTRINLDAYSQLNALRGLALSVSATNILDRFPPFVGNPEAIAIHYDPSNASPLNRVIAVELRKRW